MTGSRPRIGLLGIMQPLYDDMLPGITARQAGFADALAHSLHDLAEVHAAAPVKGREAIEAQVEAFRREGVDGLMVVLLTYAPSLDALRALHHAELPILLANVQPEATVAPSWTMAEMTYNQGVHGAQDLANALVRSGTPFHVATGDARDAGFRETFLDWASAARAAARWRDLRIAAFGHAMTGTGDLRFDPTALLAGPGPEVVPLSPGHLARHMDAVHDQDVDVALADEDARYRVDAALTGAARREAARAYLALRRILEEGGFDGYSAHFGALSEDGRFGRLPLSAASALMAEGFGYGAEGDAASAALGAVARELAGGGHFTEMYAMDFQRDTVLLSHMGEGNPAFARGDEPVHLVHRELGIGGLGPPPTVVFRVRPGPATLASLAPVGADRFRLVLAEGEVIDTEPIPALAMPYGHFRPEGGVRACLNAWLAVGGTHHQCLTGGRDASRWRTFADMVGLETRLTTGKEATA